MRTNISGKENRKSFAVIYSLINAVTGLESLLPDNEKRRLRQSLRRPLNVILNSRINYNNTGRYAESTMRRFYMVNMNSCSEIRNCLNLAELKGYLSGDEIDKMNIYINKAEKLFRDTMKKYYKNKLEKLSVRPD